MGSYGLARLDRTDEKQSEGIGTESESTLRVNRQTGSQDREKRQGIYQDESRFSKTVATFERNGTSQINSPEFHISRGQVFLS